MGSSKKNRIAFIERFTESKISPTSLSIATDLSIKIISVDNHQIKIILQTSLGLMESLKPEKDKISFQAVSYRGASGGIILFDKSVQQSFEDVPGWLAEFRNFVPSVTTPTYKIPKQLIDPPLLEAPIALVGITREPEIVISTDKGQALADELELKYFEVDFPNNPQVLHIFEYLCELVLKSK
jgi:hypothetical protein